MKTETAYVPTPAGLAAVDGLLDAVRDLVATRPAGYPAGELYAMLMPLTSTLAGFETLMALAVKRERVVKRGQLYHVAGAQL